MNASLWQSRILSWLEKSQEFWPKPRVKLSIFGCVWKGMENWSTLVVCFWPSNMAFLNAQFAYVKPSSHDLWLMNGYCSEPSWKVEGIQKNSSDHRFWPNNHAQFHPLKLSSRWWFQIHEHIFTQGGNLNPPNLTKKRAGPNMEITLRINCENVWKICRQNGDVLASHGNRVCDDASLCLGC